MPKVHAKAFTAGELASFGAALRRGDVVRAVAKGNKQIVYTASQNAVLPRLKYFVRGYREVDLGNSDALHSAFADVLRQRRSNASPHKDAASQDTESSAHSTDGSSSEGQTVDGSDAPRRLDDSPAYDCLLPHFFSQPTVSARTLKAYISAGVLNLGLRELSSDMADKNSALNQHLVAKDYPFIQEFSAFVQKYEAGNVDQRNALRWQAHGGELPEITVFLGVWARHSGGSPNALAAVDGGNELNRIAALLQPTPRLRDLPVSCCTPAALEKLAGDLSTKLHAGVLSKEWAQALGKSMAAELNQNPDLDQAKARRTCFALSAGTEFRAEFLVLLRPYLLEEGIISKENPSPAWLEEAVSQAYDLAVASLTSGALSGTGLPLAADGSKRDLTLSVDGVTYTHTRDLGKGGYCSVQLFTGPKGETLALKSPLKVPGANAGKSEASIKEHADIFTAQVEEARAHGAGVAPSDRPRPLRTADGVLRLILPYYPNGNCEDLGKTILVRLGDGTLSPRAAMLVRRAVLADMAGEVLRLKNAGLLHNDVKGSNFCIDAKGRAHLIDYGTASMGASRLTVENTKAQNPKYVACEIEVDVRKPLDTRAEVTDQLYAKLREERNKIDAGDDKNKRTQHRALNRQHKADMKAIKNRPYEYATYNQSADMWSLGVAAFELFGLESQYSVPKPGPDAPARTASNIHDFHLPFEGTHREVAKLLTAFVECAPDKRKQILKLEKCGRKSPLGRRDDAVFAMLDPDPATRIAPETLLKSRLLDDDDLENPALRALIAALGSGDRKSIDKASSELRG